MIHPPTEVQSSYTSGICSAVFLANETVYCAGNTPTRVQVTPFTPPLSYNYLCGSTLLATYLPVYCYLYAIQIIAVPINTYFLATHVPYPRLPLRARKLFQGIIWPHHWYSSQRTESRLLNDPTDIEKERPTPRSLLARDTIVSKFTEDILNLITFGLCCPLLALAISISMVVNLLIQRTLIGRFLLAREDAFASPSHSPPRTQSTAPDVALLALNQSLFDLDSSYYRLIWVVIWSSCFFIAFICWDIAGDKMGALESIWIPSLAVVFVLSLQLFERFSSLVTASWIFRCVRSSMVSRAIDLENFSRSTRTHTAADSIPESGMSLSIIHTNTTSQAVP